MFRVPTEKSGKMINSVKAMRVVAVAALAVGCADDPTISVDVHHPIDVASIYRLNGSLGCLVNVLARE